MNLATIAGHLAFGLIAFSFLVKDILWLRIVSVVVAAGLVPATPQRL